MSFEGSSEDYKENDAVLFFDGENFRLERLHRAVKRLRHVRMPGESAAAATSLGHGPVTDSYSPPVGKGTKLPSVNRPVVHSVPVSVLLQMLDCICLQKLLSRCIVKLVEGSEYIQCLLRS